MTTITELTPQAIHELRLDPQWQQVLQAMNFSTADMTCALQHGTTIHALASVWWQQVAPYKTYPAAYIGNIYSTDNEAAAELLQWLERYVKDMGKKYLIAPINGDTWHNYRAVMYPLTEPPFFLENITPEFWPNMFDTNGYSAIATYYSSKSSQLDYAEPAAAIWKEKIKRKEFRLRSINMDAIHDELKKIHELSRESFTQNFLYSPISWNDFYLMYEKVIPYIRPEFVTLLEHNTQLVAFCFAIPDYAKAPEVPDTLVIKTIARHPNPIYAQAGAFLFWHTHQKALRAGFSHIIHAYMHQDNPSATISKKSATTIRSYTLYGKQL